MFMYDPKFKLNAFKKVVKEIAEKRVCLVTGAQIYGVFLYGGMYGSAGVPDTYADNDRLADEFIKHYDTLREDIKGFVDWLSFLKVDEKVKEATTAWFVDQFPFIANTAEARHKSESLLTDFRYILSCSSGSESKIVGQIYDFMNMAYQVAPFITYVLHNYRDENDLCYATSDADKTRCIPKGGRMVKLLTCVLPRTERAMKMLTLVLEPEMGIFMSEAFFDATEGPLVNYYNSDGNIVETGLLQIIVDSILA